MIQTSKIWLRRLGITLAALLLFIVLIVLGLMTPWGTGLALNIASSALEPLEIERESGGLGGNLSLRSLVWDDGSTKAALEDIQLDINWSCSLGIKVCITRLSAGKIDVVVAGNQPAAEEPPSEPSKITLPIPVRIEQLSLGALNVDVEEVIKLGWQALSMKVEMYDTLLLDEFVLNKPSVYLPEATEAEKAPSEPLVIADISAWQYQPISLDDLFIPIDAKINGLEIVNLSAFQGQEPLVQIDKIASTLELKDSELTLQQLSVQHQQGTLDLSGNLKPDYAHQFTLVANTSEAAAQNLNLKLNIEGSLDSLQITGETRGDLQSTLRSNAELSAPSLPLALEINWQQTDLAKLLADQDAEMILDSGNMSLEGTMTQYQLLLNGGLTSSSLPGLTWSVDATGNNQAVTLDKAEVLTLDGKVELSGKLALTTKAEWVGKLQVEEIKPEVFWPEYEGLVNAAVDHKLSYSADALIVEATNIQSDGNWRGYPLMASGNANYHDSKGLTIPKILFSTGGNNLELSANIDPDNEIEASVDLSFDDLSHLYPELEGNVSAAIQLDGSVAEPILVIDSNIEDINFQNNAIESASIKGSIHWNEQKQVSLQTLAQNIDINGQVINDININLDGDASEHQLVTKVESDIIKINSQIVGQLSDTQWQGTWRKGLFASEYGEYQLNNADTKIIADWQQNHYELGAHCWLDKDAELCIKQAVYKNELANIDITAAKLELLQIAAKFVPALQKVSSDTRLFFNVKGQWRPDTLPIANINGYLTPSKIRIEGREIPINIKELSFEVNADAEKASSNLTWVTEKIGKIELNAEITDPQEQRLLNGQLRIDSLLLEPFSEFVPVLDELSGEIKGDLSLGGTLQVPLIEGDMRVEDVVLAGDMLPARIDGWSQDVSFAGQSASFEGEFLLGNGKGRSLGSADWSDILLAELELEGDNFELDYRDTVRARFSPKVKIKIDKDLIKADGKVDVFYARVKVKELPPEAQSPSEDVVLVNQPPVEKEPGRPIEMSLQVNIDPEKQNDVKLDAFGLTTDLRGSLSIEQADNKLTGNGDLNLVNGRYQAYGQDLLIRKGEILFSGPLDRPTLDIEAIRDPEKTEDDVIAGLRVSGQAEQPDIEVFSNPTMEQSEALSYLLQGKSFSSQTEGESNEAMLASVLLNAGLSGSENRVNRIGRKLGIEDLAFNAKGSGEDTQLSVTGNIAQGVQLSYEVGVFDSSSKVGLRYQLLPQLYVKAVSGAETALDIFYQFSLGRVEEADEN